MKVTRSRLLQSETERPHARLVRPSARAGEAHGAGPRADEWCNYV